MAGRHINVLLYVLCFRLIDGPLSPARHAWGFRTGRPAQPGPIASVRWPMAPWLRVQFGREKRRVDHAHGGQRQCVW
jgi:hypothetical protein